jgi:predicted phosphodiesterase
MRVGIISDLHAPFVHPMYFKFIQDTFEAWDIDTVHFIGDILDHHALSFHEHNPNGMSAETEAEAAKEDVQVWYRAFPKAKVNIGNHDQRPDRVAKKWGIPDRYLKGYKELWDTPGWDWQFEHTIDGVLYEHGTGTSGKDGTINRAIQKRTSLVMGHCHSFAGVKFHANDKDRIFGMNVGCGIDHTAYAMEYGKTFPSRGVLGCGIVIDGQLPVFEPMPCGSKERYKKPKKRKR